MAVITRSINLHILHGLSHFVLTKALFSGFYYDPDFTDEETETQSS